MTEELHLDKALVLAQIAFVGKQLFIGIDPLQFVNYVADVAQATLHVCTRPRIRCLGLLIRRVHHSLQQQDHLVDIHIGMWTVMLWQLGVVLAAMSVTTMPQMASQCVDGRSHTTDRGQGPATIGKMLIYGEDAHRNGGIVDEASRTVLRKQCLVMSPSVSLCAFSWAGEVVLGCSQSDWLDRMFEHRVDMLLHMIRSNTSLVLFVDGLFIDCWLVSVSM